MCCLWIYWLSDTSRHPRSNCVLLISHLCLIHSLLKPLSLSSLRCTLYLAILPTFVMTHMNNPLGLKIWVMFMKRNSSDLHFYRVKISLRGFRTWFMFRSFDPLTSIFLCISCNYALNLIFCELQWRCMIDVGIRWFLWDVNLSGLLISYILLVLGWITFCLQNCINYMWHRFKKVLETFLRCTLGTKKPEFCQGISHTLSNQPESLIRGRLDPCFRVVQNKFWLIKCWLIQHKLRFIRPGSVFPTFNCSILLIFKLYNHVSCF